MQIKPHELMHAHRHMHRHISFFFLACISLEWIHALIFIDLEVPYCCFIFFCNAFDTSLQWAACVDIIRI